MPPSRGHVLERCCWWGEAQLLSSSTSHTRISTPIRLIRKRKGSKLSSRMSSIFSKRCSAIAYSSMQVHPGAGTDGRGLMSDQVQTLFLPMCSPLSRRRLCDIFCGLARIRHPETDDDRSLATAVHTTRAFDRIIPGNSARRRRRDAATASLLMSGGIPSVPVQKRQVRAPA